MSVHASIWHCHDASSPCRLAYFPDGPLPQMMVGVVVRFVLLPRVATAAFFGAGVTSFGEAVIRLRARMHGLGLHAHDKRKATSWATLLMHACTGTADARKHVDKTPAAQPRLHFAFS